MKVPPMDTQCFSQVESEAADCQYRATPWRISKQSPTVGEKLRLSVLLHQKHQSCPVPSTKHTSAKGPTRHHGQSPRTHPRINSNRTVKGLPLKRAPLVIPTISTPSLAKQCVCLFLDPKSFEVILVSRDQRRRDSRTNLLGCPILAAMRCRPRGCGTFTSPRRWRRCRCWICLGMLLLAFVGRWSLA